jgi:hypothetical protein
MDVLGKNSSRSSQTEMSVPGEMEQTEWMSWGRTPPFFTGRDVCEESGVSLFST